MSDNNNSNSLNIVNNNDTLNKRRSHSNTISGGRPPALEIDTLRPPNVRRNSEGSPQCPPPISISEPTPIEPSNRNEFFHDENKSTTSSINSSRPSTPNSDLNSSPAPLPKGFSTAPVGGLLSSPQQQKKKGNRSRASSLTSNLIHEIKESSAIQNIASKIKSRHSSEEQQEERNSFDGSAPASVAGTSGLSLATSKKNEDFHALFRSVPEDDNLIEDFGCALQKEILLQGRIYISESYLCFNANIFGWVTNLVIAFEDIIDIEKKSTAYFIPNAIQVSTDSAKHFFASFLSRDQAFDLMVDIWRNARPDLIPAKDKEVNDCADVSDSFDDESGSSYESDTEDSYSDDTGDEASFTNENEPAAASTANGTPASVNRSRKESLVSLQAKNASTTSAAARRRAASEAPKPKAGLTDDKPTTPANNDAKPESTEATAEKTQVNEKTECVCGTKGEHYPTTVMDQVYNGTVEKVFKLFFEGDFMKNFLIDNQKSTELTIGEWKKGSGDIVSVREKSYIKALGGSIGPKSTKCIITEEILNKDFDNHVTVLTTTCTPDVPSGGSFSCKTKTCMTWAGKGKVRVLVTVLVDFTKSSWLKSTIEKASIDGQTTYYKELDAAIRAHAKENPADLGDTGSSKSEGRRRRKGKRSKHKREVKPEEKEVKEAKPESPVHRVLGSISNALADLITGTIDAICSPKASHLTLLCLIAMVFLNLFIARKMAYVEQQLSNFGQQSSVPEQAVEEVSIPTAQLRREYNRQEEDDLWEWLGRVDPDKSSPIQEKLVSSFDNPKEQEAVWDRAIQTSKTAKERLDRHMAELSSMIQKAESNLEQVTQAVNEQRQKIRE